MLFGISTIAFYILILVILNPSMYALRNIPWKSENKIRPSLQLSHFPEQSWKKTIKKETNKTQHNSFNIIFQNNALSRTLISHILTRKQLEKPKN